MPAMHMACPDIPDVTPIGAVPPALPMLCDTLNGTAKDTHTETANSWLDDFDHGATMAAMGGPYKRFEAASLPGGQTASFAHNNHWMVDVWAPGEAVGMSSLRPDRSFSFENGKLIVETDVAAGIVEEDGFAWPEITVTTSSSPDGAPAYGPTPGKSTGDDLYAYGHFGGYDAVGIRLTRRPADHGLLRRHRAWLPVRATVGVVLVPERSEPGGRPGLCQQGTGGDDLGWW